MYLVNNLERTSSLVGGCDITSLAGHLKLFNLVFRQYFIPTHSSFSVYSSPVVRPLNMSFEVEKFGLWFAAMKETMQISNHEVRKPIRKNVP